MKKLTLSVLLLISVGIIYAQDVQFDWAKGEGGTLDDYGSSITTDALGNNQTVEYSFPEQNNKGILFEFNPANNTLIKKIDFGDGTNDTIKNPSHTYQGLGTYSITSSSVNDNTNITKSANHVLLV